MKKMRKKFILSTFWLFLIFGLLFSGCAFAQPSLSGDRLISLPRGTVEGKLQNGLRYIILPNALPRHCVEVRMVMDVGSLQEEDNQRGGAHFLEHSDFIGTKHFPNRSLIDYFEGHGMNGVRSHNLLAFFALLF